LALFLYEKRTKSFQLERAVPYPLQGPVGGSAPKPPLQARSCHAPSPLRQILDPPLNSVIRKCGEDA